MNVYRDPLTGHRIVYHDLGGSPEATTSLPDRAPIVCVHGLGTTGMASFACLLPHEPFLLHRTLIADLPGFGLSDRPEEFSYSIEEQSRLLAGLLDSAGLRHSMLVGHSMGGSIAIRLAFDRPDLVAHLIVAEGNLDPGPGMISGAITAFTEDEFVAEGRDLLAARLFEDGAHGYLASFRAAAPRALYRSAMSLIAARTPTFREQMNSLPMPRAYVFGDENLPDPDEQRLPTDGTRVAVVPRAGHDMMNANPKAFAEIVRAVMK